MIDPTQSRSATLDVGDLVDGRYEIESVIAIGGMSTIYKATHRMLARSVALKVASPEVLASPDAKTRFLREARASAQLLSNHVVRVFDVGAIGDRPYCAMDLLEGKDLAKVIAESVDQGAPLSIATAVDYVIQACEGLAEVHARGIVHRDIKPANLFVTEGTGGEDLIKVLDFGVSRVAPLSSEDRLTQRNTTMGTPSYMAPEQMREASETDARSDVWSLGVVLYELLSGTLPYESQSLLGLIAEIHLRAPRDVRSHRADVPVVLADVIDRCLLLAPEARFQGVCELAAALAPFASKVDGDRASAVRRIAHASSLRPLDPRTVALDPAFASSKPEPTAPISVVPSSPNVASEEPSPLLPFSSNPDIVQIFDVRALLASTDPHRVASRETP